jgi:hypothetical protein
MMTPFPFQRADINAALRADATGFVVAETGAGKTLICTQIGVESGLPTKLILAPQGTHRKVWERTVLEQDPGARFRRIDGTEPGKDAYADLEMGEPGWYIATPQLFTRWQGFPTVRPALAIIDEAHLLGNRDRKGGKALRRTFKAGHRIAASGTMWRNNFENAWNLSRWIYPERSGFYDIADVSFQRWMREWCATEYDHFAPGNLRPVGELEPGRFAAAVPTWLQHFKREHCCDFHPEGFLAHLEAPRVIEHEVEVTAAQRRAISRMERDYIAWLDGHPLVAKLPIVARTRIRQMTLGEPSLIPHISDDSVEVTFNPECESPKMDYILENIYEGQTLIMASTSQKFVSAKVEYLNSLGIKAFEWSGKIPQKDRDAALSEIDSRGYKVIFGQTAAISTGLDGFQHIANELVSVDTDDDLSNEIQLEGRLDRTGQLIPVIHHKLIAKDTLDEGILGAQLARRLSLSTSLRKAA